MTARFKPLGRRAKAARLALFALASATTFSLPITAHHIFKLHQLQEGQALADSQILLQQLSSSIQTLVLIAAILAFLPWIWRAASNLHTLHADTERFFTLKATFYWFVPVLNIFMIYSAMKTLWHGSDPESDPVRPNTQPQPVLIFWSGWLISASLHFTTTLPALQEAVSLNRMQLLEASYATLAANLVAMVAVITLQGIIDTVSRNQETKAATLNANQVTQQARQ